MTYDELIAHYGTQSAVAAALNLKQPSIAEWKSGIPVLRQVQIERLTRGRLKADALIEPPKTAA